jgi:NADH:ubiquinone oxidoreductase subunit K
MTTAAYLVLGAILFAAGAVGVVVRTSAVGRLVGVELMLAAATLTFAASGVGFRELDGQVAALLAVVVAAAQAIVGYALVARPERSE